MAMNVTMPDGTVIQNVPDGTPKDQIYAKWQSSRASAPTAASANPVASLMNPTAQKTLAAQENDSRDLGRQFGLTGRYLVEGGLAPFATLADLPRAAYNGAADLVAGKGNGPRIPEQNQAVSDLLTKAGLPQPRSGLESYVGDASRALSSVGSGLGIGKTLSQASSPVARYVGSALADNADKQAASAVSGSVSADAARDAGAPPLVQMGAGLVGGGLPFLHDLPAPGRINQAAIPSAPSLKAQASAAYDRVDNSGVLIDPNALKSVVAKSQADLADFGFDPDLHPKAAVALRKIADAAGVNITPTPPTPGTAIATPPAPPTPITFKGLDVVRRVVNKAIQATAPTDKSDRAAAYIVRDNLDDFVNGLGPKETYGTVTPDNIDDLNTARDLWSRAANADTIQGVLQKAINSKTGYSQSGLENAIRAKFRTFINNPRAMARFSPDQQAALQNVVQGDAAGNLARWVGRFDPTAGIINATADTALTSGLSAAIGPSALALPVAGFAGKKIATAMTQRRAQNAINVALVGGKAANLPTIAARPGNLAALPAAANAFLPALRPGLIGGAFATQQ